MLKAYPFNFVGFSQPQNGSCKGPVMRNTGDCASGRIWRPCVCTLGVSRAPSPGVGIWGVQEIMDKEQAMLLEEEAHFQSRLEQRPVSTAQAMQLTTQQLIEETFPVRAGARPQGSAAAAPRPA